MLKSLKKNQVIIYVIALMLVTAGYLNYNANQDSIATSGDVEETYQENIASIGDAELVNSDYVDPNTTTANTVTDNNTVQEQNTIADANSVPNQEQANNTNSINTTQATSGQPNTEDYFSKSKLERDTMYSQMIETYQNIIDSSTASDEQRTIATQEITNINNTKNKIMICENLLQTKGFDKNIIFVNGQSVSVVIELEGDTIQEQIAQIQNIVSREVGVEVQNINITQK